MNIENPMEIYRFHVGDKDLQLINGKEEEKKPRRQGQHSRSESLLEDRQDRRDQQSPPEDKMTESVSSVKNSGGTKKVLRIPVKKAPDYDPTPYLGMDEKSGRQMPNYKTIAIDYSGGSLSEY